MEKELEKLGLPNSDINYHMVNDNQSLLVEYFKTYKALGEFVKTSFLTKDENNVTLQFINYGDTQLVYVLSVDDEQYAVLISQPSTEMGVVKLEHDNLLKLKHHEVIAPVDYFENENRELYVTPYLKQARCVASDEDWGVYVPEPFYHFEKFSLNERKVINSAMIGLLVKFYDYERKLGIADCKIGGGDFILEKGNKILNEKDALEKLKLISVRKLIHIDFESYLNLLRKEFVQCTYYSDICERDKNILINVKNRVPMTIEEIERGICIGKSFASEVLTNM